MQERRSTSALRVTLAIVSAGFAANGAWMFVAPRQWFGTVPGVAATGPFNPHLVRDVGSVYLALALAVALLWAAPRLARGAMIVASAWLLLHSLVHLLDLWRGATPVWSTELLGVYLPTLVAIVLTTRTERV